MQRAGARLGWKRRDVHAPTGLELTTDAGVAGDIYGVQHSDALGGTDSDATRANAYAGVTGGYPLVKRLPGAQALVEPLAAVGGTTNVNNDPNDVPNEDSIDVRIDADNLFARNRFPGEDRQEDGMRVIYGLKSGLYQDDGKYVRSFVGQSYRFLRNNGLFPQGSGLERHASDFVGQFGVGLGPVLNADYRIQLDSETLAAHRHEAQVSGGVGPLVVDTRYIYLDAIAGTGFIEPREQWQVGGRYALTRNWSLMGDTLLDFGAEPGMRRGSFGVGYSDECFSFTAEGVRNLIDDASGASSTMVLLRVGLKTIGEFEAPEITVKSRAEQ
jgi:LPS-assembly protein